MKTTFIVKSKIVKIEFNEEQETNEKFSTETINRYTNNNILKLPECFKLKDGKIFWRACIEINFEHAEYEKKFFESNEEAIQFIKNNFNNLQTIQI